MTLSIHRLLFSSERIFQHYWEGISQPDPAGIPRILLRLLRLSKHQIEPYKPDGYHRNTIDSAFSPWKPQSLAAMLNHALKELVDQHLFWENRHLYVNYASYPDWQETIGELPAVPLLSCAIRMRVIQSGGDEHDRLALAREILYCSVQPSLREPLLDDLIRKEGLHELHMHLNGTTEPDLVWQHLIASPYEGYRYFKKSHASAESIKELLRQVGLREPIDIFYLLRLGALLRDRLTFALSVVRRGDLPVCFYHIAGAESTGAPLCRLQSQGKQNHCRLPGRSERCGSFWKKPLTLQGLKDLLATFRFLHYSQPLLARRRGDHPLSVLEPQFIDHPLHVKEALLLCRAYDAIDRGDEAIAAWLHAYLVVQARFLRLLVQQRDQVGFDQFQKIPDNKLRDPVEKETSWRFHQLRGMYGPDLASIEARFSPKAEPSELANHINIILAGFRRAYGLNHAKRPGLIPDIRSGRPDAKNDHRGKDSNPPDLRLTAHFIKRLDPGQDPNKPDRYYFLCRHHRLRQDIRRKAMALAYAKAVWPDAKDCLAGIDACANEMHAPPEVFAPVFRMLRLSGFPRCTYHAGEDFMHLLSGIRAVYETLIFLDLLQGDRIGHATAVGIDPAIWLRLPPVHLGRGEWYDNVLFAYRLLRSDPDHVGLCMLLADEAARLHSCLFAPGWMRGHFKSEIALPWDLGAAIKAWELRSLDPLMTFYGRLDGPCPFSAIERQEWDRARIVRERDPHAFRLYFGYHFIDPRRWNEREKPPEDIMRRLCEPVYTALQCIVLEEVKHRGVMLESMPSSNVRISYYESYAEHHILDWLGYGQRGLTCPPVCICTDNPGIFPTTLRNEFCHVLRMLKEKGIAEDEAVAVLRRLNRNARAYRFGIGEGSGPFQEQAGHQFIHFQQESGLFIG